MSKGDQFGYSPDIGKFVTRGDKTYSEHGYIIRKGDGDFFRSMPRDADSHENYADWTDERRAAVLDENTRKSQEYEKQRDTKRDARRALVAQAKEKLTEEEFEAVLSHNGCEDRDL